MNWVQKVLTHDKLAGDSVPKYAYGVDFAAGEDFGSTITMLPQTALTTIDWTPGQITAEPICQAAGLADSVAQISTQLKDAMSKIGATVEETSAHLTTVMQMLAPLGYAPPKALSPVEQMAQAISGKLPPDPPIMAIKKALKMLQDAGVLFKNVSVSTPKEYGQYPEMDVSMLIVGDPQVQMAFAQALSDMHGFAAKGNYVG